MRRRLIDVCVMVGERAEGSEVLENMVDRLVRHTFQSRGTGIAELSSSQKLRIIALKCIQPQVNV